MKRLSLDKGNLVKYCKICNIRDCNTESLSVFEEKKQLDGAHNTDGDKGQGLEG